MENKIDNALLQISETRQVLNCLYEDQLEKKAKFTNENGPKAKKLLAWRMCKQQADSFIQKIKNPQITRHIVI